MPIPVQSNPTVPAHVSQNPSIHQALSSEAGSYRGERVVQIESGTSLIQDAAVECPSGGDDKTLDRRTIEEEDNDDKLHLGGVAVTNVRNVMGKLDDFHKSTLERVLQILMQMKAVEPFDLLEQTRRQLREPAHQYAALLALVETLREQDAPAAQIEAAEAALHQLEREQGPAIRAALNISTIAAEFAGTRLGDVQTLRATYRDAVLDCPDIAQTYGMLISKYGEMELPQAIHYLLKALGADIAADGSSIDRHKLNAALNDLYRLEVLAGLLEDCDILVQRNRAPGAAPAFRGSDLLKDVLELQKSPWVRPDQITPLPARLGLREVSQEINCLREFKELARMIPLKAYVEPEQRPRLLDAIQQALDETIEREEEE